MVDHCYSLCQTNGGLNRTRNDVSQMTKPFDVLAEWLLAKKLGATGFELPTNRSGANGGPVAYRAGDS
jgi:hypothetical protein